MSFFFLSSKASLVFTKASPLSLLSFQKQTGSRHATTERPGAEAAAEAAAAEAAAAEAASEKAVATEAAAVEEPEAMAETTITEPTASEVAGNVMNINRNWKYYAGKGAKVPEPVA